MEETTLSLRIGSWKNMSYSSRSVKSLSYISALHNEPWSHQRISVYRVMEWIWAEYNSGTYQIQETESSRGKLYNTIGVEEISPSTFRLNNLKKQQQHVRSNCIIINLRTPSIPYTHFSYILDPLQFRFSIIKYKLHLSQFLIVL